MQEGVLAALEGLDAKLEGDAKGEKESHSHDKIMASDEGFARVEKTITHHYKITKTQSVEVDETTGAVDANKDNSELKLSQAIDEKKRCKCSCFGRAKK